MSQFSKGDHVVLAWDERGQPIEGGEVMEIEEIVIRYEARCRPLGCETAGQWFKTLGLKKVER